MGGQFESFNIANYYNYVKLNNLLPVDNDGCIMCWKSGEAIYESRGVIVTI